MTSTTEISFETLLENILAEQYIPRATYRLQFNPNFRFQDAQAISDYLQALGISDLYTSPLYEPREGSTHGYDTVDYNQFNPLLGTEEDFDRLVEHLKSKGMSLLLDIVPNHMGIGKDNRWWMDVLKHGPSSVYSAYFDIDWQPKNRALDNKVLLPVLGDHYGRVLESGELKLVYWHGDFYLHYYENQYPVNPDTYADILEQAHKHLTENSFEKWQEDELLSITKALSHIPSYTTRDKSLLTEMRREQKIARQRIVHLYEHAQPFRTALDSALETINGIVGEADSFNLLDRILERQAYRLSFWRAAADEINYRRFFDINELAAIRIEHPNVFSETHRLTFRLLGEGKVKGLRIDHPDGLWNPQAYFQQLQEEFVLARLRQYLPEEQIRREAIRERLADLLREDSAGDWALYIVVEKILSETEPLPYDWYVYGTTGYDFMNTVNNLFVDRVNESAFNELYENFLGQEIDFGETIDFTKRFIMSETLSSELYARSSQLADIVEANRRYRGFTRHNLEMALIEITAALPIYRTYITPDEAVSERDRFYIEQAVELAKLRNPRKPAYLFDFVRDILLMELFDEFDESSHDDMREFVMQYQQMTGPVMAKSVEDTAFYIYNRLVSLNEVGGHPEQFGISIEDFHAHNANKAYPQTMLGSSTHDTKRSEDVRARINVLSEIPDEWAGFLEAASRLAHSSKIEVEGELAPSPNDEYLLYQTLLGAYPLQEDPNFEQRIVDYMRKAINEAKVNSTWLNFNEAYHQALANFIHFLLSSDEFAALFTPLQQRVSFYGFLNSLSQTLLKLTVTGVPDIYQGNEMWRYSLVDPDNRRPVNYEKRQNLLNELLAAKDMQKLVQDLTKTPEDGRIKLYTTAKTLRFRRDEEDLFRYGTYIPLKTSGAKGQNLLAFLRDYEGKQILVAVPRLVVKLTEGQPMMPLGEAVWGDTLIHLPEETTYQNIFTGESVQSNNNSLLAADVFKLYPVAVLKKL